MARRYHRNARGRGIDCDDLFGEACLTLVRAAEGFDASRGATFRHYALAAMRHTLARAVRRHRPCCPLSRAKGKLMELPVRSMPDPDTIVDVQTLLSRLGPVERGLVEKWFGLDGGEVWSLKQLAAEYRSSPVNVRPMLERALATLRRCAGSPADGSGQAHPNCLRPRPPTWS
jgi:RNA polymerase sigma factor (sigma-70 family)